MTFKQLAEEERRKSGKLKSIGRIVVCDRCKAQTNAIEQVFNCSNIIFCEVHIMRNIRNNCGLKSNLLEVARNMFNKRTKEWEDKYVLAVSKLEASEFKKLLIEDAGKYLPSVVDRLYHRGTVTSNPAEEVFSVLKREAGFRKQPLVTNLDTLMGISERWITDSINSRRKNPPWIFRKLVERNIGNFALDYLTVEIVGKTNANEQCQCLNDAYRLPCRHQIAKDFNSIYNIPEEYFNENIVEERVECLNNCVVEERDVQFELPNVYTLIKRVKHFKDSQKVLNQVSQLLYDFYKEHSNSDISFNCNTPCPTRISQNCNPILNLIQQTSKRDTSTQDPKEKGKKEKKPKKEYITVHTYY